MKRKFSKILGVGIALLLLAGLLLAIMPLLDAPVAPALVADEDAGEVLMLPMLAGVEVASPEIGIVVSGEEQVADVLAVNTNNVLLLVEGLALLAILIVATNMMIFVCAKIGAGGFTRLRYSLKFPQPVFS